MGEYIMNKVIDKDKVSTRICGRCYCDLEKVDASSPESQIFNGLQIHAEGYYGGFWDTLPFMGERPADVSLCHDCCVWLCKEIPAFKIEAKDGHIFDPDDEVNPQERCCDYAYDWSQPDPNEGSE